jgi:hypothetical protein
MARGPRVAAAGRGSAHDLGAGRVRAARGILKDVDVAWEQQVRSALLAEDGAALHSLFDEALAAEGRMAASRSWLAAISAFDADAVTG